MLVVSRKHYVYKFNELSEKVKEKVISDYIDYLMTVTDFDKISKNSKLYKAYKKAEEMQTPWFLGSYIWDMCSDKVMKEVESNMYLANGIIFTIDDTDEVLEEI